MSGHHNTPAPPMSAASTTPITPPAPPASTALPARVPMRSDAEIQAEAERQRARFYGSAGGRARTMLTGGSGAQGPISSAVVRLLAGA